MKKRMMAVGLAVFLGGAGLIQAGDGYPMKCMDKSADGKECGYEAMVTFGGGMMFHGLTFYCRKCGHFGQLHWTAVGSPLVDPKAKVIPKPEPLGEIWDAATGRVLTIYACPQCQGPAAEIKSVKDLTHCPKCGGGHFRVDPGKPRMAID